MKREAPRQAPSLVFESDLEDLSYRYTDDDDQTFHINLTSLAYSIVFCQENILGRFSVSHQPVIESYFGRRRPMP
jgi:hypothetical protein